MTSSVNFLNHHWRKCKILKAQLCSIKDFLKIGTKMVSLDFFYTFLKDEELQ